MIDAVRDLFDIDDPGDPEAAVDAVRDEVVTEVPRGLLSAVAEGVTERALRRADGRRDLADMLVNAVSAYYDPGRSGPRDESRRREEAETVREIIAGFEDRLDELDAEREDRETANLWAFGDLDHAPLAGHAEEDGLRRGLQTAYEAVRDRGAVTADECYRAFRDGYDGTRAARFATRHLYAHRWLSALDRAPGVERDRGGLWTVDTGDALDDDALLDAIPVGGQVGEVVARLYRTLRDDAPATTWELGSAAGKGRGTKPATLRETGVLDALRDLPGVEPPGEDVPAFRSVDTDDDGGEP